MFRNLILGGPGGTFLFAFDRAMDKGQFTLLIGVVIPDTIFTSDKSVLVCGSTPCLGQWKVDQAPKMKALPKSLDSISTENGTDFLLKCYDPFLFRYACITFGSFQTISYKFILSSPSSVQWEGSGSKHNRKVDLSQLELISRAETQKYPFLTRLDIPDNGLPLAILPVVGWNDVQENKAEAAHTATFATNVLKAKSAFYATKVTDRLWIGSCPRRVEHISGALKRMGITIVLNLQELIDISKNCPIPHTKPKEEASLELERIYEANNIQMIFLPTVDMATGPKRHSMVPAALILSSLLDNGHVVYVHCNCGIGRAVGAVCSYLVCCLGWTPEATNFFINMIRPISYCKDLEGLAIAQKSFKSKFGQDQNKRAL